jgi:hypothetical protein
VRLGWSHAWLVVVCVGLAVACSKPLQIKATSATVRPPSNIVLLFRVDGPGGPAHKLGKRNFTVQENGVSVPAGPDLRVVRPYLRDTLRLLVLLDLGGHPTDAERKAMISATRELVSRLSVHAQIAVYVFDGSAASEAVVVAQADDDELRAALDALKDRSSSDSSTDLHGALVTAIKTLQLESDPPQPHTGMLVLISRSPDRAARVSKGDVEDQFEARDMEVMRFVTAFGPNAKAEDYEWLAGDETIRSAANPWELGRAARQIAKRIDAIARSYQVVSLCSGVRAGDAEITITAKRTIKTEDGDFEDETGELVTVFDANEFGPDCTPWAPTKPE